jgi:hypothetical protein
VARKPPKSSVPQRANWNAPTRWKKGESGNPGGKAVLPDWFKSHKESALAMRLAAGLGVVIELEDDTPEALQARKAMARDCPLQIRDAASKDLVDKFYKKEEGDSGDGQVTEVRITVVRPDAKLIDESSTD